MWQASEYKTIVIRRFDSTLLSHFFIVGIRILRGNALVGILLNLEDPACPENQIHVDRGWNNEHCCLPQHSGVYRASTRRCQQLDATFECSRADTGMIMDRLVRANKWRRPRQRVHPAKPTVGIRATRPNEVWHLDTTLIRLLDGSKAYLHAIIDNFSRRVLAWRINDTFIPAVTAELLIEAAREIEDAKPQVLVGGGVENYNSTVDQLVESGLLKRILAQTEIRYSNSLIESWWRVIKHQWLFLNTLDTAASVKKLVAFYVEQHNSHLPHSAFEGQTPDEMYFGTGDGIPKKLEEKKLKARELRLKSNRERNCHVCLQSASATR